MKRASEVSLSSKCELEKELLQYKELVSRLNAKLGIQEETGAVPALGDERLPEERIRQLEKELQSREDQLRSLKDFEKIKEERDQLLVKLKNQARQFEQYVRNQKQVSAELNLSPRSSGEGTDFQKIKEIMIKEVREEMEQKVVEELRSIEEEHRERRKELEGRYKGVVIELQKKCNERTRELDGLREALLRDKEELKMKDDQVEEERNLMAQVMTKWAAEVREIKGKEAELNRELLRIKESEEKLSFEVKTLRERERRMEGTLESFRNKYEAARKTANNYKEHAKNKEKFLLSEYKRIEEGYKRAINQAQQKLDAIMSTYEEQVPTKLKEIECQYAERTEQMRLTLKYKSKC